jgi:hypothetical protein
MRKQPQYSIFLVLTIISTLAALSTLVPHASASDPCFLGYSAHCPFSPVSTVICFVLSSIFCRIRVKKFKNE